jgi:hypothetical protein
MGFPMSIHVSMNDETRLMTERSSNFVRQRRSLTTAGVRSSIRPSEECVSFLRPVPFNQLNSHPSVFNLTMRWSPLVSIFTVLSATSILDGAFATPLDVVPEKSVSTKCHDYLPDPHSFDTLRQWVQRGFTSHETMHKGQLTTSPDLA